MSFDYAVFDGGVFGSQAFSGHCLFDEAVFDAALFDVCEEVAPVDFASYGGGGSAGKDKKLRKELSEMFYALEKTPVAAIAEELVEPFRKHHRIDWKAFADDLKAVQALLALYQDEDDVEALLLA